MEYKKSNILLDYSDRKPWLALLLSILTNSTAEEATVAITSISEKGIKNAYKRIWKRNKHKTVKYEKLS